MATYTYEPPNPFLGGEPSTTASGDTSSFSYAPTGFATNVASSTFGIATTNGVVGLRMFASPGNFFTGTVLSFSTSINYTLSPLDEVETTGVAFAMPFTVYVAEVNGSGWGIGNTFASKLAPDNDYLSVTGPGGPFSGTFTRGLQIDVNELKTHYNLTAEQNITGMVIQMSPSLTVWTTNGAASANMTSFNIQSTVVPEPSTASLLLLGLALLRRRLP